MEEVQKTDAEYEAELLAIMAESEKNVNSPDFLPPGYAPIPGHHKGHDIKPGRVNY